MSLRRISILAVLTILGSALAEPNYLLPQAIAQNTQEQRRPNRNRAQWIQG